MQSFLLWYASIGTFVFMLSGCGGNNNSWNTLLPAVDEIVPARGFHEVRTIIHLHSNISYDACDPGNTHCVEDLRQALCTNHVDFAFLTDHPNSMSATAFDQLHLSMPGDQSLTDANGAVIGNQITCGDSHQVKVMAGYEDKLMPIGMTQHLEIDPSVRLSLYKTASSDLVSRLRNEANAIVFVPHTESRSDELLTNLKVDGIEIYNQHANINPKMRYQYLGLDYFSGLLDLVVYWIDPYGRQQPDLAFLSFLTESPVYAKKWATLISKGQHVVGIGGNDSHQNFFSQKASDGYRIDAHRRLIRWVTNHFLVGGDSLDDIKAAIRAGRGWVEFEGLGTAVGVDFHAETGNQIAEIGDSMPFVSGQTSISVQLPVLSTSSPRGKKSLNPVITIRLKRIDSSGNETLVATSLGQSLSFVPTDVGAYRAEIGIVPLHLKPFIGYKTSLATHEFPWIITNHIYLQ